MPRVLSVLVLFALIASGGAAPPGAPAATRGGDSADRQALSAAQLAAFSPDALDGRRASIQDPREVKDDVNEWSGLYVTYTDGDDPRRSLGVSVRDDADKPAMLAESRRQATEPAREFQQGTGPDREDHRVLDDGTPVEEIEDSGTSGRPYASLLLVVGDRFEVALTPGRRGEPTIAGLWAFEASGLARLADDAPTVLVVEDNADLCDYLHRLLAPAYRIAEAADRRVGLDAARAAPPDLVVSDVMMSEMDGVALCRALKDDPATAHVPVVLLTARTDEASRLEGLAGGADDYLGKPFSSAELLARCENLIELRWRLRDRLAARDTPEAPPESAWATAARAAVEANLANLQFGVEWLADAMATSARTLHRQCRDETGLTPAAFIRSIRLERAANLLAGGRVTAVPETAVRMHHRAMDGAA